MADMEGVPEDLQAEKVASSDGMAEIYPEDKYRIVKLLQSKGFMVGMTGDGVNDAPALKQAEMGIAVSNSTDVAKASASVVLTQPGLGVIVDAVKRSRETYQRMLTWVLNKVTKVVQVVGVLTLGFFLLHEMVISMLDMALILLANDFVTMSLATDNVTHTVSPNNWNVKNITFASLVIGALAVVEGMVVVLWGAHHLGMALPQLQTFVMLMLVFTSQFNVLILRERRFFWNSLPGKALLTSSTTAIVAFAFLGVYGVIIPALRLNDVLAVLAFTAVFTVLMDVPKRYAFEKFGVA